MHAVLGQRAGLVRGNHGDGAKRLDRAQPPDDSLAPGKPLDAQRQCQREHGGKSFRNGGHGQRHREQEHLAQAPDAFDHYAADRQDETQRENGKGNLGAELAEPALERRLAGLDSADHGGKATHRALGARAGHLQIALALDEQGAAEELPAEVLVDRQRFARQDRLIDGHALAEASVPSAWDPVARLDARRCRRERGP